MSGAHALLAEAVRAVRLAVHARDPSVDQLQIRLERLLVDHLTFEEAALVPAWAAHGGPFAPNATPAVLLADHRQLRQLLDALQAPAIDRAASVARCDALWRLQGVLEHHDVRETRNLVPWLATRTDLPALPPLAAPLGRVAVSLRPADWATERTGDPVEDLMTALAGAAPDDRIAGLAEALQQGARAPREARLAAAVVAVQGDRPLAWDRLRLVRAVHGAAR